MSVVIGSAGGCDEDKEYGLPGVEDDDGGGGRDAASVDSSLPSPDAASDAADPTDAGVVVDAATDGVGPTIAAVHPLPGTMVSGTITLQMTITDENEVDSSSVIATVGGITEVPLTFNETDAVWEGSYDTTELAGLVFPTVVVRAADVGGTMSNLGYTFVLDNQAPLISLDPPLVREAERNSDGQLECSVAFDPVGSDAPDDGDTVRQLIELRARIEDIGNFGTTNSAVYIPRAGIDNARVQLYILDDAAGALIVDGPDADDVCDQINPLIVPRIAPMLDTEAAVIDLLPAESAGESYAPEVDDPPGADFYQFAGSNLECVPGTDTEYPDSVCLAAEVVTRIPETEFDHVPMIYAPAPVTEGACMGFAVDARATHIADGWACVAVVASDHLGNTRVSPVMRICIQSGSASVAECEEASPDCTGTLNSAGMVDTATSCSAPATFTPPSDVAGDYELIRTDL